MEIPGSLFAALNLVVFRRRSDGTFAAEGQSPGWFSALTDDLTFPFLGSFLETANAFWARSSAGTVRSGLCAQVDAAGREFHYEVVAVSMDQEQYLVFERRLDAEATREVLQRARDIALEHERVATKLDRMRTNLSTVLDQVDASARTVIELSGHLMTTTLSPDQRTIADRMLKSGLTLTAEIDTIRHALLPKSQG